MSFSRELVVKTALDWLGTPYHHQGSLKGVGVDCIGLVRGVYKELYGFDPETKTPRYSPSWGDSTKDELLLRAASTHLARPDYEGWKAGDVLVFRVKNAVSAKHCGIVIDDSRMIHAVQNRETIITSVGSWSSKVAGVFSYPGVK